LVKARMSRKNKYIGLKKNIILTLQNLAEINNKLKIKQVRVIHKNKSFIL
jgi:hypothetical protein